MKLKYTEKNYNRLSSRYKIDIYEDNGYNVFSNNEILMTGLPSEQEAMDAVIEVFNDNISKKAYRDKNANLFKWYYK